MLNKQEDQFAMNLYLGESQIKAYRKAFPKCKNWKDETVYVKASVLSKTDKVKVRINEIAEQMQQKTTEKGLLSATDVLQGIADIYERNKEEDDKTAMKALELYGKHLKLFTDKIETVNHNFNKDMTEEEADEILKKAGVKVE